MKLEIVEIFIKEMGGIKQLPKEYLIELLVVFPSIGENDKRLIKSLPWNEEDLEKFRKGCTYLSKEDLTKIKQSIFIKKMKK